MARGTYCDHCGRELFGIGPWHDESCDSYSESYPTSDWYTAYD